MFVSKSNTALNGSNRLKELDFKSPVINFYINNGSHYYVQVKGCACCDEPTWIYNHLSSSLHLYGAF